MGWLAGVAVVADWVVAVGSVAVAVDSVVAVAVDSLVAVAVDSVAAEDSAVAVVD